MADLTLRYRETALTAGGSGNLLAILTEPVGDVDVDAPTAVFLNAGIIHRVGPNRLYVQLARALAGVGVRAVRFDFSGIGDSRADTDAPAAAALRTDAQHAELQEVLRLVKARGFAHRFVLIGLCSGADAALLGLVRIPEVVGAVLLDPYIFRTPGYYVRYYGPRLFNPLAWWRSLTGRSGALRSAFTAAQARLRPKTRSDGAGVGTARRPTPEEMRRDLRSVLSRDGRLLFVFTSGLPARYYYRKQAADAFPGLFEDGRFEFEYYADADHTFSTRALRDRLEKRVLRWYGHMYGAKAMEIVAPAPGGSASAVSGAASSTMPAPGPDDSSGSSETLPRLTL